MNHTVNIIYKQIKVEAFTVYDYYHLYPKFLDIVLPYIREGKITYVEDIAKGLKNDPATPEAMFKGRSAGKQERSQRTVERVHLLKVLETRKSALQKSKAWHLLVLLLLVLKLTIYRL
ncbi:hypothetical protein AAZX31_07G155900 [Glycine max]|uniref:Uncharacterized protein n=1 Tax=Glycine max TaxID=3847 RepID=K7L273_SOYBN|nr:hypothetical protein JHK87_018752 [Glycine soja]KAG5022964.1 hypothetical protein JHK85_019306 [Glycine max]KAG5038044.1 hypothetical protein JHK86_018884 [Glycine max]KAG5143168.1 hypothetical protein JHK82_018863 [Glycine max]KAH1087199.1 hypothetical protein GYH30_018653 [Glycine max]